MKSLLRTLFTILFVSIATAESVEIKLCYEDTSVFPWITGEETGLVFTELHNVEKRLKIKFTFIRLPWKRCQLEGRSGNVDGLIAASFNKERTEWGVYPTNALGELLSVQRLHTDSFYIYVRKDSNIKFENGKFLNLANNKIGVQLGYSVGHDLRDAGYATHSSFSSALDLVKELDYSSLQVAVLQDHESLRVLNEQPKLKRNIVRLRPAYKVADQYLLFTKKFYKKNKELSQSIWEAIPLARKCGRYTKLEKSMLSNF